MSARTHTFLAVLVSILAACSGGDDDTPMDASTSDAGHADTGFSDAGTSDSGVEVDAGFSDAGSMDAGQACTPPEMLCGSECVDLTTDEYCGACDRSCVGEQHCIDQTCQCDYDLTDCNGTCVDTFEDVMNCGACNRPCGGGEVCLLGVCGPVPTPITSSVSPHLIASGAFIRSLLAEKLAVDASNRIYAAVHVADGVQILTSTTQGRTFSAPVSTGLSAVQDVAITGGAPGRAYLSAHTTTGFLVFSKTEDGGATWSAPRVVDGGPLDVPEFIPAFRPNIVLHKGHLYVAAVDRDKTEIRVWRSSDDGDVFEMSSVLFGGVGGNMAVEPNGDLVMMAESQNFLLGVYVSRDRGRTWTSENFIDLQGNVAAYALARPHIYANGGGRMLMGPEVIDGRYDIQDGTFQAFQFDADVGLGGGLGGAQVALGEDGTVYMGGSRSIMMMETRRSIVRFPPNSLLQAEVREVTDLPEPPVNNGLPDLAKGGMSMLLIPGSTAIVTLFGSEDDLYSSVEIF